MPETTWKNPTTIIALGSLALSVVTLVFGQMEKGKVSELQEQQLALEKWKAEADIELRRAADERVRYSETLTEAQRQEFQTELAQVKKDIAVWDGAVLQSNTELSLMKARLQNYEFGNQPEMAEAMRKNIELQEGLIARKQGELTKSENRRAELEALLN